MVAPNDEAHNADAGHGEHHRFVAEDGSSSRRGQNLGDDAERRNDDHVHFGVPEEPEQVLEKKWVSTGYEEGRSDGVVKQEEGHADDERRQGHEQHEHADEHRPGEQRHFHPRHARCTHGEHRGDEVHTAQR